MKRLLVAALAAVMIGCGGSDPQQPASTPEPRDGVATSEPTATGDLNTCSGLIQDEGRACYSRELAAIVNGAGDPLAAVEGITQAAYADQGGFLLANCHGIMHTVAREYALRTGLKLDKLMDSLPRTNDPGCSAGYAHGLVTAVAPEIERAGPKVANRLCANSETRYQRYSCTHGFGHAFMRLNNEAIAPSLQMCEELGSDAAADCSQGIYHDYWFAVNGIDATKKPAKLVTDPRELCGAQPEEFVRVCWYRSFVETAKGTRMESGEQIDEACSGLEGLQRAACVTGASVIGPPDPVNQLAVCSGLEAESDVVACIRGTKVQNLMQYPDEMKTDLIKQCGEIFRGGLASACHRWLGKTLGVISDGKFRTTGCPELSTPQARRECVAGVKSMEGPLVTFS
ncbi:hypothetical protein DVA67_028845 [Solirubrobacter sp. CPCC 204708]|uniref:Lipoprotein n=1 Tax=Solirubrobacter deserti TaxID=2282478 RepID=A0ABT4RUL7_9ACTN|nr:hypothetical protein [Solirubrobacter deserti]MBE2320007.1 hypothetical protein [Solirubrobacter deserti]MDA0141951.1 hypothetical protein [Solirubrobacter deserti]